MEQFKFWLSENKKRAWAIFSLIILIIFLPIAIFSVQQIQNLFPQAWVCNQVQTIKNDNGTYNVVVTQGSASWWRIIKLPSQQVVAEAQTTKIFNNITLAPGEYQINASDNKQQWTTQNCTFIITPSTSTLSCTNILLYNTNDNPITVNDVFVNQIIKIAVAGQTSDSQGITKARFSFNNGTTWTETTTPNSNNEFYIEHTVINNSPINVSAQVFNPTLGWK